MSEEKKSSKKLSLFDLTSLAAGMIIGSGVMTMMGIAIGITGRSVVIALVVAAILTLFCSAPQVLVSGTVPFPGGYYTMFATLCNKQLAGIYNYINLFTVMSLSFAGLSFASYFSALFPGANTKLVCIVVMTILLILHLVGVKQAAVMQNLMMAVLIIALAMYIILGLGHVEPDFFEPEQFMTAGVPGFILASVFLSFAYGGGTFIVNYSSEAQNPRRDIPLSMIISTFSIVIFYVLIAIVAVGVLPVAEAANEPLSTTAAIFMSKGPYTFFVVGGAMFALLTSMNFYIGSMVYPSVTACQDGWLPKWLSVKNKRFGTHHRVLLVIYIMTLVPVIFGIDMRAAANCTIILTMAIFLIASYAAMSMPKKIPELWAKSKFHVGNGALKTLCIMSMVVLVLSMALLIFTSSTVEIIGNLLVLCISAVLGITISKRATVPVPDMDAQAKEE